MAICLLFNGCYIPITHRWGKTAELDSPFQEFGLGNVDNGGIEAIIRDKNRNLRGMKVLSVSLIDAHEKNIPIQLGYIQQSPDGQNVTEPSHYATIYLGIRNRLDPSKLLKRPADPFTLNLTLDVQGEILKVSGVFEIETKTNNLLGKPPFD